MKGLLLKDFYMATKYCRSYLLIAVVFIAVSFVSSDNFFFMFYPCLLCGMIPVNLLAYDERSHWLQYSGTLPYSKAQIVSGKYLTGLIAQLLMLVLTGIAQIIRMNISGTFNIIEFLLMTAMIFTTSVITSSICLPFMFKLGVEKGRIAYYVTIGIVCALGFFASRFFVSNSQMEMNLGGGLIPVFCLVSAGIYALSWYLSIVFFQKREII